LLTFGGRVDAFKYSKLNDLTSAMFYCLKAASPSE